MHSLILPRLTLAIEPARLTSSTYLRPRSQPVRFIADSQPRSASSTSAQTRNITEVLKKTNITKRASSCVAGGIFAISCLSTAAAATPVPNNERQIFRSIEKSAKTEVGPQLETAQLCQIESVPPAPSTQTHPPASTAAPQELNQDEQELRIIILTWGSSQSDLQEVKALVNMLLAGKAHADLMSTMGRVSYAYNSVEDMPGTKCQIFTIMLPKHDLEILKQMSKIPKVKHVGFNTVTRDPFEIDAIQRWKDKTNPDDGGSNSQMSRLRTYQMQIENGGSIHNLH